MPNLLEVPKPKLIAAFHETAAELPQGLGTEFENDPFAVQQALLKKIGCSVSKRVLDYTRSAEHDDFLTEFATSEKLETSKLVKLERNSFIKACVDIQHDYMIEGEGVAAQFKDQVIFDEEDALNLDPDGDAIDIYELTDMQRFSRTLINGYQFAGDKAVVEPQAWFDSAARRNSFLFRYFVDIYGAQACNQTPATTRDLKVVLTGGDLVSAVPHIVEMVNDSPVTGGYSPQEKLQAARDLSYLGLRRAAQNLVSLTPFGIDRLKGEITVVASKDGPLRHIYRDIPTTMLPNETADQFEQRKEDAAAMARIVFGYKAHPGNDERGDPLSDLDEASWGITLKCPVLQSTKKQPISNLQCQQHAAFKKAYETGLFY